MVGELRPEIALGWRRSQMSGLDPGMEVREPRLFEVDRHSRLIHAAKPVLTSMVRELDDTRFSILLADHSARIVDRRLSNRTLHRHLDRVKAIPGAQYIEELSGTNSLSTAFELRKPISVAGDEHFLEALRVFCCYGAPIIHPITRRLEGVLDVTGPVADQSNLLGPFLMRAVRDIEQRLHEGSRLSEQRLFADFQSESARNKNALVLFGENLALSNAAAMDLISSDDNPLLQAIAAEVDGSSRLTRSVSLTSGRDVDIHARLVADSRDGVIMEVVPRQRQPARRAIRDVDTGRPTRRCVLVTGPPGSGRSTRAREMAGNSAVAVDLADDDGHLREQLVSVFADSAVLILDNVHAADASTVTYVRHALSSARPTVIIVCGSVEELSEEHQALAATADETVELPHLRDIGHTFATTVQAMVSEVAASNLAEPASRTGSQLRMTPSALAVLAEQDWPGNLAELARVVRVAARGRSCGDITADDLPESHRRRPARGLTPLERAERATISAAMAEHGGNKVAVAHALGIGRNTLYQRLRYYRLVN
ncbi:Transcriptional regulator of acetoin/glycerol metabolism [Williamsia sterculiae]|uniref:Transcriptional regulator of acetoin/glycerol metabolism n=1 Tax=Williamsia sterculiae TaxID=1344003 RepID=A0A1N7DK91_9NOCA|nr:Transcriptional regulator of acetoin/glycerol metabolism [Williamsia sterculiae]